MSGMAIGEVARRAGLRPSALRYYESVGLLPEPRRVNGRRRYDHDVLIHLAGIRVAQEAGFTVAEIRQLFHGFPAGSTASERWRELAQKKLKDIDDLIRRAREMKALLEKGIRCNCSSLRECSLVEESRASRK